MEKDLMVDQFVFLQIINFFLIPPNDLSFNTLLFLFWEKND